MLHVLITLVAVICQIVLAASGGQAAIAAVWAGRGFPAIPAAGFLHYAGTAFAAMPVFAQLPVAITGLRYGMGFVAMGFPYMVVMSQLFALPEIFGYSINGFLAYVSGSPNFTDLGAAGAAAALGSPDSVGSSAASTIENLHHAGFTPTDVTAGQRFWSVVMPGTTSMTANWANAFSYTQESLFGTTTWASLGQNSGLLALAIGSGGASNLLIGLYSAYSGSVMTVSSTAAFSLLTTLAPVVVEATEEVVSTSWSWTTWIGILIVVAAVAAGVWFMVSSQE